MKKYIALISFLFLFASCSQDNIKTYVNIKKKNIEKEEGIKEYCIYYKNDFKGKGVNEVRYKYYFNGKAKELKYLIDNLVIEDDLANKKVLVRGEGSLKDFLSKVALSLDACYSENMIKKYCTYFISDEEKNFYKELKMKVEGNRLYLKERDKIFLEKMRKDKYKFNVINYKIYIVEIAKDLVSKLSLDKNELTELSINLKDLFINFDKWKSKIKIIKTIYLAEKEGEENSIKLGKEYPYIKEYTRSENATSVDIDKVISGIELKVKGEVLKNKLIKTSLSFKINQVIDFKKYSLENIYLEEPVKDAKEQEIVFLALPGQAVLLTGLSSLEEKNLLNLFGVELNKNKYDLALLIVPSLKVYKVCLNKNRLEKVKDYIEIFEKKEEKKSKKKKKEKKKEIEYIKSLIR